ncbi:transposase [Chryseobacterium indologenes]|uniref:Transposase n=2 Tax=Chryseobacterium indologenes TaxID=253 RepID=A0A0N0IVZ7_CHRID|nr:transposase [Chryseobacterium indologenes]
MKNRPDYRKIYTDMVNERYPDKKGEIKSILSKENLSMMDVITCSSIISGKEDEKTFSFNQKHRFFDEYSILHILDFQKKNGYNNTQISRHFKLSRNTISKWKKRYL